jgi:hypothetical protein
MAMIGTTHHAVDALCLFYPRADEATVLAEVSRGLRIDPSIAVRLVGRQHGRPGATYVLHRERTGLFVVSGDGAVITFLRFYALTQHELACTLYGPGDPPTCTARWHLERLSRAEREAAEDAERHARLAAERAQAKAERQAQRMAEAEKGAAKFLRKRGWTVTPPQGGGEGT